ncbi:MAG: amidase domain-containing protein [Mycobacteriaceae bacterium]
MIPQNASALGEIRGDYRSPFDGFLESILGVAGRGNFKDDSFDRRRLSPNRQAALSYSDRWAASHNPSYAYYGDDGGDCTNFASQVMRAGGFSDDGPGFWDLNGGDSDDWYYNTEKNAAQDNSTTWSLARENHNYVTQHSGRGQIVGVTKTPALEGLDPLAPSHAGLIPGDLIYYKNKDGDINHVGVYMGQQVVDGILTDVVNQHSAEPYISDPWMPRSGGNYVGGESQAEFVHLKYPGE